ncbi:MAG: sulfite exporter TauE/SafE family protein [Cyanobacteria bacterium REEB459]|nr:sulfite exporter TauE/SafE family protein [Cyanobacteria bacterium REEB459]
MIDLWLMVSLGFLGSFGHCLGMCGPLSAVLAMQATRGESASLWSSLRFHLLLNLGRLISYGLVGAAIGAVGSVLVAGGQMAGLGSGLRQGMAWLTGILLIWVGLTHISPGWLPPFPLLHPLAQPHLGQRLNRVMETFSDRPQWWTPLPLGLVWGLIPCGFLYTAQIKAAETTQLGTGALTMVAFGLGTLPMMVAMGFSTSWLSRDRRSQLFYLGGWLTLLMGGVTLTRTGDTLPNYPAYGSLACLVLSLIARPLAQVWPWPRRYRRGLGVAAWWLALLHALQAISHNWQGDWRALSFMLPQYQWGIGAGGGALALMLPLVLTSSNAAQTWLGRGWTWLHRLSSVILGLTLVHGLLLQLQPGFSSDSLWKLGLWGGLGLGVMLVRSRLCWQLLSLEKYYGPSPP